MSRDCRAFRALLEQRLGGRPAPERLTELSWQQHLFVCAECRRMLEAEEALESLLASLPEPHLAPDVRARVLVRLRAERELDVLLELDADAAAPAGLSRGVLAGLAAARAAEADARLDALLELDRSEAPAGLAGRTLLRLGRARRPLPVRSRWLVALAAAAVLALIAWAAWPGRGEPKRVPAAPAPVVNAPEPRRAPDERKAAADAAPDDLLAALDVLQNWDVLVNADVETMLSTLPADDEALLATAEEGG
jgi:tetratricopeptide (TPR) repeat protein